MFFSFQIQGSIDCLNIQVDQFEGEIESLQVAQKKKRSDKEVSLS